MQRSGFYFSILITVTISALMLYFTGLIPAFGEWYSYDQTLRLQTEAFLRGELALQPVPYGLREDASWGNGLHQVWWLGLPLFKLPFEIIAKLFGSFGFPDRLHFLLLYAFVTIILWKSLSLNINPEMPGKERSEKRIQSIPVLIFLLLNPPFINMMYSKFEPYEEVIAYGYLWTFLIFALLIMFINNHKSSLYFLICFLAGFSPNIRPTIGAYGLVTFLMAFYFAGIYRIRFRMSGFLLFLIGPVFILVTNFFRFGNPLEFGHALALTRSPIIDYALRFDNPLKWLPFKDVALELLSALFFVDLEDLYVFNKGLLWQANVPRMREFNFKPYDFTTLVLLLLSWIIVALMWARRGKGGFYSSIEKDNVITWGGLWSFCGFIILFLFYSRNPAIAARHLVDFAPAIALGIVILYLYIVSFIRYILPDFFSFRINITLSTAFLVWIFFSLSNLTTVPLYDYLSKIEIANVTTYEIARKKLETSRRTTGPPLPIAYRCGDREIMYGIPFNNIGWKTTTDCGVFWVTTHFLDSPTCLSLHVEPTELVDERLNNYSDTEIKVKVGLTSLHRISEMRVGSGKVITYCPREGNSNIVKKEGFKLISIAWIDFRKHSNLLKEKLFIPRFPLPPIKLLSLEKVR